MRDLRTLALPSSVDSVRVTRCAALAFSAVVAVVVAVGALAHAGPTAEALLFLLPAPVAVLAAGFGVRGGAGAALAASALAVVWWATADRGSDATLRLSALVVMVLLVGLLVGTLVDSRVRLTRSLQQHARLSLDLIATADYDGYFTQVNPAFTQTLGYSAHELVSKPFLEFVHPDDRPQTLAELERQTKAGQQVLHFQNRYRHRNGSYRWLEWTSRPDTKAKQLIAVARDVTDRKQLEQLERDYQDLLEQAVRDRTRELQQRNHELEQARHEVLRRLALAAEYRDDETFEHTTRVGRTAAHIAAQIGLSDEQIRLLREAAPLHDVGKLGVSDTILLKRGKLTSAEYGHVQRHAAMGAAILAGSTLDVLALAEQIALTHHEWWDGTGYPNGLRGEQIPLCGRIVAIADVFDALTHTRPYKEAWPLGEALDEIQRLRGTQLDPHLVDAFAHLDHAHLAGLSAHHHATNEHHSEPQPTLRQRHRHPPS